ncbi:uncharacterized protein At2g39795, mitochondrial-like [Tasmannia lanceolata]|uniref:uncharacterized protein At2g39795, mitochondrial-like n=1 Tax=Tasmannia lanceolata TaxID=3420 RepID=UPI004064A423
MLGAISSLFRPHFLYGVPSSRKPHYCSLIAYSSIGTKISQTPLESSSLLPFNNWLSYSKMCKTRHRLDLILDEKRIRQDEKMFFLGEKMLRKYDFDEEYDSDEDSVQINPPKEFPFKIINEIGKQSITLERDLKGQSIQVEVLPLVRSKKEEEEKESWSQLNISLLVKLSTFQGISLEFYCIASSTHITVDRIQGKLSDVGPILVGPKFVVEKFQKYLNNFLEVRGIDSSLANFLQDYMIWKDAKQYLAWLRGTCGCLRSKT